jgi:hypothetical protein
MLEVHEVISKLLEDVVMIFGVRVVPACELLVVGHGRVVLFAVPHSLNCVIILNSR